MANRLSHFLYRFKYHYGRILPLRSPVDVSLELASVCQLRCGYCYHADQKNLPFTKGFMHPEVACKILDQAHEIGVSSIKFNWKGESTMSPHFPVIVRYASLMGFTELLSNSNFMFEKNRIEVIKAMCHMTKVKVSLDSFRQKVLGAQRVRARLDIILRNIEDFYKHPDRKGELIIQAVRTKANQDEDIEAEIRKRWPGVTLSIRDCVGGRNDSDYSSLEYSARDTRNRQACRQAFVRVIFNHKGDAFPCCPDIREDLNMGNIQNLSLSEIFNGPIAKKLRQDLHSKQAFKRDPCMNCSSFETFKGYKPVWSS